VLLGSSRCHLSLVDVVPWQLSLTICALRPYHQRFIILDLDKWHLICLKPWQSCSLFSYLGIQCLIVFKIGSPRYCQSWRMGCRTSRVMQPSCQGPTDLSNLWLLLSLLCTITHTRCYLHVVPMQALFLTRLCCYLDHTLDLTGPTQDSRPLHRSLVYNSRVSANCQGQ
jgi:hypothetical protein